MNKYAAFYKGQQKVVMAEGQYAAYRKAILEFKPPIKQQHMVHVYLIEKDGEEVLQNPAAL